MFSWFSAPAQEAPKRKTRNAILDGDNGRPLSVEEHLNKFADGTIGTNGVVTQAAEYVPGVNDVVGAIHSYRGEDAAAERARARSLQKYLSKDGALTKAANLIPGSNLLAAAYLEGSGHHEDALRALDLLQNWRDAGKADGALTKLAEMFPGTDLVAFGVHASHGDFAHALRSIVKTRWVEAGGDAVGVVASVGSVGSLKVREIIVDGVRIKPVSGLLWGACIDLAMKAIKHQVAADPNIDPSLLDADVEKSSIGLVNHLIAEELDGRLNKLQQEVNAGLADGNSELTKLRNGSALMRALLPSELPPPRTELIELLQDVIGKATVTHGPAPQARRVRGKYTKYSAGLPEALGAASCLSFLGSCSLGPHLAVVGCLSGCVAGALQGLRLASTRLVPMWNDCNADAGKTLRRPPDDPYRQARKSHWRAPEQNEPQFVCIEIPRTPDLEKKVKQYVVNDFLSSWALGRFVAGVLRSAVGTVRPFIADLLSSETKHVPQLFISITTPSMPVPEFPLLTLPPLPLVVVLDLRLRGSGPLLRKAQVVISDKVIDMMLENLSAQFQALDLRTLAPQRASFTQPVSLKMKLALAWEGPSLVRIVAKQPSVKLSLPE
mmetsp:Transcript_24765/g.70696  ORF Transcript_24765/g.70696 Transcript_24765/m.70696 type:complete len:608 (-) Transcript_24765:158-1981(-)